MEMIRYLEKVGDVQVSHHTIEEQQRDGKQQKQLIKRDWYGILADHPNRDETLAYFDNIRDEWDDRY